MTSPAPRRPTVMMLMEDYRQSYTLAIDADPDLARLPYDDLARAVYARGIYYGDSYLHAFAAADIRAQQYVAACMPLQRRWAAEQGRRPGSQQDLTSVVHEQVRQARPDVLWVFSGVPMSREDVAEWRRHAGTVVLWWSCPLREGTPYDAFDLILSCIQPLVGEFRTHGLRAEFMSHAFDARILSRIVPAADRIPRAAFVGSLSPAHHDRIRFLDALSRTVPLDFYGHGRELLPSDSPLRANAHGPVWGDDLYRVYATYALVVHKNIDVAGPYASAKRLFEATGMGACVLAEQDESLGRLFNPTELAVYADLTDATRLAAALLEDPARARSVGQMGQQRTLATHTYQARVEDFRRMTGLSALTSGAGGVTLDALPQPPAGRSGWPWTEAGPPLGPVRPDGSPWPRVSIVTPSFNQAAFLEETIRSVLLQGYPNLEYLIVDGGSTDESVQIIRRYEPWLAFWTSEPDAGQSDALNKGFARTTGEILGWLNSDDYLAPGALRAAARALTLTDPAVGAVVGVGSKVDDRGNVFYSPLPEAVTQESLFDWCSGMNFMQPACFFTRDAWTLAGPLRVDLDYCMDLALWLRIAARHRFIVIGDTLAFVHTHEDAKSIRSRHRMFGEIALLLAVESGDLEKGRAVLYSVLDADDSQKRGVKHLAQALGREVLRRLRTRDR